MAVQMDKGTMNHHYQDSPPNRLTSHGAYHHLYDFYKNMIATMEEIMAMNTQGDRIYYDNQTHSQKPNRVRQVKNEMDGQNINSLIRFNRL